MSDQVGHFVAAQSPKFLAIRRKNVYKHVLMPMIDEQKPHQVIEDIKRFWEHNGVLENGDRAYVRSFRDAVEADRCIRSLMELGVLTHVHLEQALTDIGYTAVRLDGDQFDRTFD